MAPKAATAKPLIKGQGSLANYFSGGGITRAQEKAPPAASSPASKRSGTSKSASEKAAAAPTPPPPPKITQLEGKVTVRGYTPASPTPSPVKSKAPPARVRVRKTVSDDEDEDVKVKTKAPKVAPSAKPTASSGSDSAGASSKYFSGTSRKVKSPVTDDEDEDADDDRPSSKSSASTTTKEAKVMTRGTASASAKKGSARTASAKASPAKGRSSTAKSRKRAIEDDEDGDEDDDDDFSAKDEESIGEDYEDGDEDVPPPAKRARKSAGSATPKKSAPSPAKGSKTKSKTQGSSKGDAIELDDDDEAPVKAERGSASTSKAGPSKGKAGSSASTADHSKTSNKASDAAALKAARERAAAGPNAPGSKEIPEGKPNCLSGLTFVFTGQLESLARDEAQNLVKRYGAKVTSGPSSKTSFVVLGEGAGPSKIKTIEANGIKTLSEDGLLDLIRERGEQELDEATAKKLKQEDDKIKKAAKVMDVSTSGAGAAIKGQKNVDHDVQSLWTVKYAPNQMKDVMGNNAALEKLKAWLDAWPESIRCNFQKGGRWGQNTKRAMLISGPPGIGKTTSAHLVSKLCGFTPIELNASDTRSKRLIEDSLKNVINNKSLDGWYHGGSGEGTAKGKMTVDGITITDKSVLILDEVDGMSGGDRGGIGAINQLIKKTKIPIILIANDKKSQKMKPFMNTTFDLAFTKPRADTIRARLMTIAYREGLKLERNVLDQLIEAAQSDMRAIINMLSTWSLSQKSMSFDDSKKLGDANIKPGMSNPFTLYNDLAAHGLWAASSKKNLNAKADIYFQDPSILPLFVQENYLRQRPQKVASVTDARQKDLKTLQLMTRAAGSISDGDVIDSMIHGPQQHWGLMPLHAQVSTVKPMSLVHGMGAEGSWGPSFPSWLGNNSKLQRLSRAAVELQVKMRLAASGSRWEVREQYAPYLFTALSEPLVEKQAAGIEDVISVMDDYYLGLEDRETIFELGVGDHNGDKMLKKIPTAAKSAFTRAYNAKGHPIAFHKGDADSIRAKAKQLRGDNVPDVEEAIVDDDFDEASSAEEMSDDSDGEQAVGKDKMIKEKKAKGKGKATAGASNGSKAKKK